MPDVGHPLPFDAYRGPKPFLFVSYAHKDGPVVFADLKQLHSSRYRIWYDEGIDPGNEWPDEIAKALDAADFFLVFISEHSVASRNVKNEINYALNKEKPFLAVYIADVTIPPGLALRMGDIQAIMKWRMEEANYIKKLKASLPDTLRETQVEAYTRDSVYRWWKVIKEEWEPEGVQVQCQNCGLQRTCDPRLGDKPPDTCPACGFDGEKAPKGPWYATRSEGLGDRAYICRKCKNEIFVTH